MSELQTIKTAIHEIAHAKLHDIDLNAPEQAERPDRSTREVQAESVAYTVCQHFGLDTSDYSFGYVAGWSSGRDIKELKASLETIRTAASELISEIEGHFAELQAQHTAEQEQDAAQDMPENTFSIYQLKDGDATRDLRFEPLEQVTAAGLRVDREIMSWSIPHRSPTRTRWRTFLFTSIWTGRRTSPGIAFPCPMSLCCIAASRKRRTIWIAAAIPKCRSFYSRSRPHSRKHRLTLRQWNDH